MKRGSIKKYDVTLCTGEVLRICAPGFRVERDEVVFLLPDSTEKRIKRERIENIVDTTNN